MRQVAAQGQVCQLLDRGGNAGDLPAKLNDLLLMAEQDVVQIVELMLLERNPLFQGSKAVVLGSFRFFHSSSIGISRSEFAAGAGICGGLPGAGPAAAYVRGTVLESAGRMHSGESFVSTPDKQDNAPWPWI
jgi:hypothetical protein